MLEIEIDADASPLVVQYSVSVRQDPFVKIYLPNTIVSGSTKEDAHFLGAMKFFKNFF